VYVLVMPLSERPLRSRKRIDPRHKALSDLGTEWEWQSSVEAASDAGMRFTSGILLS
jgi:hypothetical protein